jgi:hypothetical protein
MIPSNSARSAPAELGFRTGITKRIIAIQRNTIRAGWRPLDAVVDIRADCVLTDRESELLPRVTPDLKLILALNGIAIANDRVVIGADLEGLEFRAGRRNDLHCGSFFFSPSRVFAGVSRPFRRTRWSKLRGKCVCFCRPSALRST